MNTKPDASNKVDSGSSFNMKQLTCGTGENSPGTQSVVAVSGSTIAFASLALTKSTQTCTIMPLGPVEMSQVPLWDVCYATGTAGGTYTSQVVTSQPYLAPTGVGLALDSSGNANIAYTGVGSTPAMDTCGANDVFVTTAQGGTFGTATQVSMGSQSDALVAAQMNNCTQNVCGTGDTTGFWPSIGISPGGTTMIAYRDTHLGFATDDYAKSDVEFAEGTGTSFQVLTIDVSRGGGQYNRLAFTPAGLPAVLQYDQKGQSPGVYIDQQVMPGGFSAQSAVGVWTSQLLATGEMGIDLGFAISSTGVYAVAYFDQGTTSLKYTSSKDGMTWSAPEAVDVVGNTGYYPSLAFDTNGNPNIAYYRCNDQGVIVTQCDPATDALLLATYNGTKWTTQVVSDDPNATDGLFPALAFVGGKAVIAYQETSADAITQATTTTWWVAEEP